MMKTAVSVYSFYQAIKAGRLTVMQAIAKAKEMGFDGFEFVDFATIPPSDGTYASREEYAAALRSECEKHGLAITNFAFGADFQSHQLEEEIARVKKEIDIAAILGAPIVRHDVAYGSHDGHYESFDSILPRLADAIREVTEYAAAKGIKTTVENHGIFVQDALRVEKLMNAVHHPNFGWLVDMGNFTCADENPAISVGIAAPYAFNVHAKDFIIKPADGPNPGKFFFQSRNGNYLRGTIVGQGNVPVKHCLKALKKTGYDGYVAIEFEGVEDCLLALEAGLENLKRYIAEVENAI